MHHDGIFVKGNNTPQTLSPGGGSGIARGLRLDFTALIAVPGASSFDVILWEYRAVYS
jgi:hypothetical protein